MINIFCDGGCIVGKGVGAWSYVTVIDDVIILMKSSVLYSETLTNNQCEYDAIIHALIGGYSDDVTIHSDSEIVIKQINGEYKVKDAKLVKLNQMVKVCCMDKRNPPHTITFVNVPRTNKYIQIADKMNKIIMNEAKSC